MERLLPAAALAALVGCVSLPVARERGPVAVTTARAVHLARVRCLLVAPFENAWDDPLAAEAATGTYVSGIDASRTTVYPIRELRSVFKDTSLELPEGVSPSLALELAELIGADAALYGAVEGRSRGVDAALTITLRLAATGARDLLFSRVVELAPNPDLPVADQVHRAVLEASAPMLERLGVPGRKACFDRQRTDRLRLMAIAGEQRSLYPPAAPVTAALPAAPAPEVSTAQQSAAQLLSPLPPPPPPPQVAEIGDVELLSPFPRTPRSNQAVKVESGADLPEPVAPVAEPKPVEPVRPAVTSPEAAPAAAPKEPPAQKVTKAPSPEKTRPVLAAAAPEAPSMTGKALTVRQAEWLTSLQRGGRVLLGDVTFVGRTGLLERDAGLRDVVALLAVAPNLAVRIEGFVDATNDADGDLRLSMEMARTVGRRLIDLGVARDRLTWAGRGGDGPILPNFTARGRMTNRRVELLVGE